ncbi:hypothetical protein QR680_006107 [Steinernema hermaphroditum]|uniref:Uncharacterized protein n=1 Tax=Steinernema hermaphroditum TaxID=289476 RepID=A0AA39HUA7_9BILA|nr:hypothetical protein QR680_006107 [Steinernema hermaphroditum]
MYLIPYSVVQIFNAINIFIQYPSVIINILIIYISFRKVNSSLPRTYCLNISIPSLLCSLHQIARDITERTVFKDHEETSDPTYTKIVKVLDTMLPQSTLNLYLFQTTLTVVLAYIGFSKPFLYKRLTKTRAISYAFIVSQALSWLLAAGSTVENFSLYPLDDDFDRTALCIHTWARAATQLTLFAVMGLLYLLTIVRLTMYACRTQIYSSGQQSRWLILRSVLIYCTPPNVFIAVGVAGSYCSAVILTLIPVDRMFFVSTCTPVKHVAEQLITPRLFVTSLSALFAFADYRKAITSMFSEIVRRKKKLFFVTARTVSS